MDILRVIRFLSNQLTGFFRPLIPRGLIQWLFLSVVVTSCESDPYGTNWNEVHTLTISQYLEKNQEEYSKFLRLLDEGKLLTTLYAYNPYGEDYTLFLPTDEAIDNFLQQHHEYANFDELLLDTNFIYMLTRYHTLNRRVHSDEFPDGALNDKTLTGERLVTGFHTDGNTQFIKINNKASIIKSNLKMTNGYIHVISDVLQQTNILGYDWLQQQANYSILAQAMELSGIRKSLWWSKYTLFAEHDSIYHREGIRNIQDLISRIATPGMSYTNKANSFYKYVGYHIMGGEFFLNDLFWGSKNYTTMGTVQLTINVGVDIKINPGIDTYGIAISESGDTTVIDYIRPVWARCNIPTSTGPIHSISNVLYFNPLP